MRMRRRPGHSNGLARSIVCASGAAFAVVALLHGRVFSRYHEHSTDRVGLCALLPPPPSASLARAPSVALDRFPHAAAPTGPATGSVSILPEPVERPLKRYLHKYDPVFDKAVPDWLLQYETAEQQYLYEGDFTVFVREVTDQGCVVQDSVTGILGFVEHSKFGKQAPFPGAMIQGAMCTHMDLTVVTSPDVRALRMQTGIVYEWDDAIGEGYIIPTEWQNHRNMLRVLRRDIDWHGSNRLVVGQFVQFETALPGEVPIDANDDRQAPFALRVRSPEVHFSFERSYKGSPEGVGPKGRYISTSDEDVPYVAYLDVPKEDLDGSHWEDKHAEAIELRMQRQRHVMPVESGRPLVEKERSHPVLLRWMEKPSPATLAESPAWLWEAPMHYEEDEDWDPILPLQLNRKDRRQQNIRILQHEVALQRGDVWQEPAARRAHEMYLETMPQGNGAQQTVLHREAHLKRRRAVKREKRRLKLRAASLRRLTKPKNA
mmetsp:Transcript_86860/g.225643  ORF Transcript_86860/g.225643 Transcript_86860/m.225643 type:complete len:489 (+) Transcript_86860:61-1527(+)